MPGNSLFCLEICVVGALLACGSRIRAGSWSPSGARRHSSPELTNGNAAHFLALRPTNRPPEYRPSAADFNAIQRYKFNSTLRNKYAGHLPKSLKLFDNYSRPTMLRSHLPDHMHLLAQAGERCGASHGI